MDEAEYAAYEHLWLTLAAKSSEFSLNMDSQRCIMFAAAGHVINDFLNNPPVHTPTKLLLGESRRV